VETMFPCLKKLQTLTCGLVFVVLTLGCLSCSSKRLAPQEIQCSEGKILRNGECQAIDQEPVGDGNDSTKIEDVADDGKTEDKWQCERSESEGKQIYTCDGHTDVAVRCLSNGTPERKDCKKSNQICRDMGPGVDDQCVTPGQVTPVTPVTPAPVTPVPTPPTASWICSRSLFENRQVWTCGDDGLTLNRCDAAGQPESQSCDTSGKVCEANGAGTDDRCVDSLNVPWDCTKSSRSGVQYWTCHDTLNKAFKCHTGDKILALDCQNRGRQCVKRPLGSDDICE
jgi:hypothetical protein